MGKINVAEILKGCTSGMELDCTMYDDVYFDWVDKLNIIHCYIQHETHKTSITFNQHGTPNSDMKSKCVIFPKGKTTWEGFKIPFKDGDIVAFDSKLGAQIFLFKEYIYDYNYAQCYLMLNRNGDIDFESRGYFVERFATEEEKEKLFQAIKDNGYRWNPETKTLGKLPKFKVGDRIRHKENSVCVPILITNVSDEFYYSNTKNSVGILSISEQDEYELVPVEPKFKVGDTITNGNTSITIGYIDNEYYYEISRNIANRLFIKFQDEWDLISDKFPNKFNITTFKPFDSRVLVRHTKDSKWCASFFSHIDEDFHSHCYKFVTTSGKSYPYCIPYEGNEHLLNTTNDCDEFYRNL